MYNTKSLVALVDIETSQNVDGDRTAVVTKLNKIIAFVDLVGVMTLQLAQAQSITLNYSIEIDRRYYNNQIYCYLIDQQELCQVKVLGKAKSETRMLLNVSKIEDDDIKNAILLSL